MQVSAQVSPAKEPREFPWSGAAKIIAADEAKAASKPKKPESQPEAETKKREKTANSENKKSK